MVLALSRRTSSFGGALVGVTGDCVAVRGAVKAGGMPDIQCPDAAALKTGQDALGDTGVEMGTENALPVPAADATPAL